MVALKIKLISLFTFWVSTTIQTKFRGFFYLKNTAMTEDYDELEWDIDELPIGSSTPDEQFEISFNATSICPKCQSEIVGTAYFHSDNIDMSNMSLASIDYSPCNCDEEE